MQKACALSDVGSDGVQDPLHDQSLYERGSERVEMVDDDVDADVYRPRFPKRVGFEILQKCPCDDVSVGAEVRRKEGVDAFSRFFEPAT